MVYILRHKAGSGKLAVYDDPNPESPSDGPIDNPLGNLDKIAFHSDLRYPAIIPSKIVEGQTTVPSQPLNKHVFEWLPIYAHGMSGTPVVFGKLTGIAFSSPWEAPDPVYAGNVLRMETVFISPLPVPLCGSVPIISIRRYYDTRSFTYWRGDMFIAAALGADNTHVALAVWGPTPTSGPGPMPPIQLSWKIYVLDAVVDGSHFEGDPSQPLLQLSGTRIRAGRGKFDTERGYLRKNAGTDQSPIVRGPTMALHGTPTSEPPQQTDNGWGYRWSVAGSTLNSQWGGTGTFNASFDWAGI